MRTPTARLLACIAALCGLLSGTARGAFEPAPAAEMVAVLKLPVLGLSREVAALLRTALRETLQAGGFNLVDDAEVENKLARDPELTACRTRSCFARAALTLGVRRVIEGEIQRPQRSSYAIRLQLRDLRTGQLASPSIEERCDICTTEDARQMVVRAAERLFRSAPPPSIEIEKRTGTLQIDSQPIGAEVLIDGEPQADRTPATFLLAVGVHGVQLRAPGYRTVRRPVEIGPGQNATLNLELSPVPPRRPWLTALSIGSALGTLGLGIGSGLAFYYDQRPAHDDGCPDRAEMHRCPEKWDTLPAGIGMAVGAGALLVVAGVTFYLDHAPPRRRFMVPAGETKTLRATR